MHTTPAVLTIQDLSAVGRCSITVILPILSLLGSQVIPLPTAVLSNHLGFPHHQLVDFSDHMEDFMNCWDQNDVSFSAILSGFLATPEQIHLVQEAINRYGQERQLIIIDPAMADHGELYSVYTPQMVQAMRELIRSAQVITPNFTEAAFLLDEPYHEQPLDEKTLRDWCRRLHSLGPKEIIITSLPADALSSTAIYDGPTDELQVFNVPLIPLPVVGTGDIFAATLTGYLLKGFPLYEAATKAVRFTWQTIDTTWKAGADSRYGVLLEQCLPLLLESE